MTAGNGSTPLRPGMHVQPSPLTVNVSREATADGNAVVLMHVEHATGSTILVMESEFASALSRQMASAASGIHLPGAGGFPHDG